MDVTEVGLEGALLVDLYWLIINADSDGGEKAECTLRTDIARIEKVPKAVFAARLAIYKSTPEGDFLSGCIKELSYLPKRRQTRWVAWACTIANTDGFMSKKEWAIIYRLYHTELKLNIADIMSVQKELYNERKKQIS